MFIFLLFAAVPLSIIAWKPSTSRQVNAHAGSPESVEQHASGGHSSPTNGRERIDVQPEARLDVPENKNPPHNDHSPWSLFWDEPQPSAHCLGFGKREYTAKLRNVPFYANWVEACERTEVTIRGIRILSPSFCESKVCVNCVTDPQTHLVY